MSSAYDLPEWAAFVARIKAQPDDDLPRLVAADWLDEHGETERAEFIRVQCEHERLHPHLAEHKAETGCDACARGYALSGLLLGRFKVPDDGPLPFAHDCPHRLCNLTGRTRPRIEWDWRRGFVAQIRCTLADWGVCAACRGNGVGSVTFGGDVVDCSVCDGTGRTVGIGPAIAAAHPVERVAFADCQPLPTTGPADGPAATTAFVWRPTIWPGRRPHLLPPAWFRPTSISASFDSLDAAHAWASDRALAWARGQPRGA